MGLLEAREDVAWAAPILVLILPHDLLTATEVVRHLLLHVLQGAVHSAVKNWIFILISLKFTWGELCKRPGLRLQIGSMPTSQLTRGSANDLWTFHWVSLCPNSIHWCVELYQLSNYKYDYKVCQVDYVHLEAGSLYLELQKLIGRLPDEHNQLDIL